MAILLAYFPGTIRDHQIPPVVAHKPDRSDWTAVKNLFTAGTIKWVLASFSQFKSPGADGIFLALLQQGEQALFSKVLGLRDSLSNAKVIITLKVGKKDYSLPKSFRPIGRKDYRQLYKIEGAESRPPTCKSARIQSR